MGWYSAQMGLLFVGVLNVAWIFSIAVFVLANAGF
jgi:hypothetical protein